MNSENTAKLKKMVKSDNKAIFTRYFDGQLWYEIVYQPLPIMRPLVDEHFEFPVPISDIGSATFHHTEKAILLMRYIRKHLEMLETAKGT